MIDDDDDDDDECGAVGEMSGKGNRNTRRKPAPVSLCPRQIPYDLGSNSGHRGGKLATNILSYGAAWLVSKIYTEIRWKCY
jgi:hypothetical protein